MTAPPVASVRSGGPRSGPLWFAALALLASLAVGRWVAPAPDTRSNAAAPAPRLETQRISHVGAATTSDPTAPLPPDAPVRVAFDVSGDSTTCLWRLDSLGGIERLYPPPHAKPLRPPDAPQRWPPDGRPSSPGTASIRAAFVLTSGDLRGLSEPAAVRRELAAILSYIEPEWQLEVGIGHLAARAGIATVAW